MVPTGSSLLTSKRDPSTSRADAFTGSERERKNRPASVGMTVFGSDANSRQDGGHTSLGETNRDSYLQAAEESVEFVGGVEVGFQFARVQPLANVIEASREQIERR